QRNHIVGVTDRPLQHGIIELELETAGWPDAALGGKGAAEHGAAVRQAPTVEAAPDQLVDRQHGLQRPLLVQLALTPEQGMRAQDHPVPMANHILELPQDRRDRLVAHLLGDRDAVTFDFAVGMVGAAADEDATLPANQHELDLTARLAAADLDLVLERQS